MYTKKKNSYGLNFEFPETKIVTLICGGVSQTQKL